MRRPTDFTLQLTTERLLYPRKDAAYQLGVSVRTLDYLVARKELETRRIGKKVLITRRSLVRFANANHYEAVRGDEVEQTEQAA
jgi:excisionase family DNA binding protein